MLRVLFVCAGNTCRSPLAEAVLRLRLAQEGLRGEVASAGTRVREGATSPDPRAGRVAGAHGLLLEARAPRRFEPSDFDCFDGIVALDAEILEDLRRAARTAGDRERVALIAGQHGIPDPWHGDDADYARTYDEIAAACERLLDAARARATDDRPLN